LLIYQTALLAMQEVSQKDLEAIKLEVEIEVREAVSFAQESAFPDPADIYQNMYSTPIHYPA